MIIIESQSLSFSTRVASIGFNEYFKLSLANLFIETLIKKEYILVMYGH